MSASLIGHLGSSAFRLSTTTVSMSLAGSCFSSESAPGPLYGAFFVKEFARAANLLSFVSFFVRSQSPFLRPDPRFADVVARRSCQGWPPRQPCGMLRACQAIPLQLRARRHAGCDRDDDQRGARFRARISRAATLYSVGPRTRTMMQSYASAAKLRSGGPILPFGIESQGNTSGFRHLEPSSATRHQWTDRAETVGCPSVISVHYAGRRTTPSGTTPSRTRRHRAISSLRAKATIMVLRVPRALSVRARNHCAKVLSFWNMRNRHANWIMPRRTRALPERVSPFSRRFLPLSSGEPVRPA